MRVSLFRGSVLAVLRASNSRIALRHNFGYIVGAIHESPERLPCVKGAVAERLRDCSARSAVRVCTEKAVQKLCAISKKSYGLMSNTTSAICRTGCACTPEATQNRRRTATYRSVLFGTFSFTLKEKVHLRRCGAKKPPREKPAREKAKKSPPQR